MRYKIVCDTHTHTIANTHAYSTLGENVAAARAVGLEAIAMTDHAHGIGDGPHPYHFTNMRVIPRVMDGIVVLRGCEANIMDYSGSLDLPENMLAPLDWVIASMHNNAVAPGTPEQNTAAWLGAIANPVVDVVGHCGSPGYDFDHEAVVLAAKEYGKLFEINNSSPVIRKGSEENCMDILNLCKQHGVGIVVSSDAHIAQQVGRFGRSLRMLELAGFPEELVLNTDLNRLLRWIELRRGIKFDVEG